MLLLPPQDPPDPGDLEYVVQEGAFQYKGACPNRIVITEVNLSGRGLPVSRWPGSPPPVVGRRENPLNSLPDKDSVLTDQDNP
jgi:hypothetical protein